jgi:hypothetical protein
MKINRERIIEQVRCIKACFDKDRGNGNMVADAWFQQIVGFCKTNFLKTQTPFDSYST